jgi:hypothetical protein
VLPQVQLASQVSLSTLHKGEYFVLGDDLFYVSDVVPDKDYYLIEDCKTLNERYLKKTTMDRMRVRRVNA